MSNFITNLIINWKLIFYKTYKNSYAVGFEPVTNGSRSNRFESRCNRIVYIFVKYQFINNKKTCRTQYKKVSLYKTVVFFNNSSFLLICIVSQIQSFYDIFSVKWNFHLQNLYSCHQFVILSGYIRTVLSGFYCK